MKKQLTITTNTEALGRLRYLNSCLEDFLKKHFKKNETFESLKHLHHNIYLITNLYKKEIDDYENFLIQEADDYHRFNKVGKKLHLTH